MKEIFDDFLEKLDGDLLVEFTGLIDQAEAQQKEDIETNYVTKEEHVDLITKHKKLEDDYINRFREKTDAVEPEPEPEPHVYTLDDLYQKEG